MTAAEEGGYRQLAQILDEVSVTPGMERVSHFIEGLLGRREPAAAHPLQKGGLLHFPGIRASAWHDAAEFEMSRVLEDATPEILDELLKSGDRPSFQRYTEPAGDLHSKGAWSACYFYYATRRVEDNHRAYPKTAAAIERVAGLERGFVVFSVLSPGTMIPPHRGLHNTRLRVHLPLVVPDDCGIRVGGEAKRWQVGRCLVFDDSFEHAAWNAGKHARVVLLLDVWHPELSAGEIGTLRRVYDVLGKGAADGRMMSMVQNGERFPLEL